jgi:plasmid stabilization system protein ParE
VGQVAGHAQAKTRSEVPQVVYSRNAVANLERLHRFLTEKNPEAARRAIDTVLGKLKALERFPRLGPVDPDRPGVRQVFMPFGAAGCVARYRIIEDQDTVIVLAVRHMREAGDGDDLPTPPPQAPSSRRRRS